MLSIAAFRICGCIVTGAGAIQQGTPNNTAWQGLLPIFAAFLHATTLSLVLALQSQAEQLVPIGRACCTQLTMLSYTSASTTEQGTAAARVRLAAECCCLLYMLLRSR